MRNPFVEPGAAARYDSARRMPQQAVDLWLGRLRSAVSGFDLRPELALDLGCGTGRFTFALAETFDCRVIGADPSEAMLAVAGQRPRRRIDWIVAAAENIPLGSSAADLVFMSQVFHHLLDPDGAVREIRRVSSDAGCFLVRNSTRETNARIEWLEFFPEARSIESRRIPSRDKLADSICRHRFQLASHETVEQYFGGSYAEYFEKISRRGLSSLLTISDSAFESGLKRFEEWVRAQPADVPVHEPIDLFVFRKV